MNTKLLSFVAVAALSAGMASCAGDDVAESNGNGGATTSDNLTTFTAGVDAPVTRTSLNYNTGNFFWENGDKIWVQNNAGTWVNSANAVSGTGLSKFTFNVPGAFGSNPQVVYHGNSTTGNQVEIAAVQTQETPNDTKHFGASGDYGIATASLTGSASYRFKLDHKAAYIVFQPYTNNDILKSSYLTKIEVSTDGNDDIAGTYTINPTTGQLSGGTGTGNKIVLNTKGAAGSATEHGFSLNTTSASLATNAAYMVIKPGTHTLRVRYWVKNLADNIEGCITRYYNAFNYDANGYYDIAEDLEVKDYPGNNYYMWDAQKNYWDGHEWNSANPWQPTVNEASNSNYPQSSSDARWYNESFPGITQTTLFKSLPNANELAWYAEKGDPRWDADELWTTMGHLYKGGMWFLKKDKITSFNANNAPDGYDWRTTAKNANIQNPLASLPSISEINNYFYLPALGFYHYTEHRQLRRVGLIGYYHSQTAHPMGSAAAIYSYYLDFGKDHIIVNGNYRSVGAIAQPFK